MKHHGAIRCNPGKVLKGYQPLGFLLAKGSKDKASGKTPTSARSNVNSYLLSMSCALKRHKSCKGFLEGAEKAACLCECHGMKVESMPKQPELDGRFAVAV